MLLRIIFILGLIAQKYSCKHVPQPLATRYSPTDIENFVSNDIEQGLANCNVTFNKAYVDYCRRSLAPVNKILFDYELALCLLLSDSLQQLGKIGNPEKLQLDQAVSINKNEVCSRMKVELNNSIYTASSSNHSDWFNTLQDKLNEHNCYCTIDGVNPFCSAFLIVNGQIKRWSKEGRLAGQQQDTNLKLKVDDSTIKEQFEQGRSPLTNPVSNSERDKVEEENKSEAQQNSGRKEQFEGTAEEYSPKEYTDTELATQNKVLSQSVEPKHKLSVHGETLDTAKLSVEKKPKGTIPATPDVQNTDTEIKDEETPKNPQTVPKKIPQENHPTQDEKIENVSEVRTEIEKPESAADINTENSQSVKNNPKVSSAAETPDVPSVEELKKQTTLSKAGTNEVDGMSGDIVIDATAKPNADGSENMGNDATLDSEDTEAETEQEKKNKITSVNSDSDTAILPDSLDKTSFYGPGPDKFVNAEDSHFFAYFMTMVVLCILGYLVFHNKQKILALALEGRSRRGTRRRPNTSGYRKLDSNLEEAVTSTCSTSVTHVIY